MLTHAQLKALRTIAHRGSTANLRDTDTRPNAPTLYVLAHQVGLIHRGLSAHGYQLRPDFLPQRQPDNTYGVTLPAGLEDAERIAAALMTGALWRDNAQAYIDDERVRRATLVEGTHPRGLNVWQEA